MGRVNRLTVAILLTFLLTAFSAFSEQLGLRGNQYNAVTTDGIWCWYGEPKAIYHKGIHEKTYLGWITTMGGVTIASFDHETKQIDTCTIKPRMEPDDHDHPSILVRPDGRIIAVYSGHNLRMYTRTTINPEDITSWGPEQTLTDVACYPNLAQLSADSNRIFLFFRGDPYHAIYDYQPCLMTSLDGTNWTPQKKIIQGADRPYVKYETNGVDEIHIVWENGHRNNPHNMYYAYYKNGAFYKADGSLIKYMAQVPVLGSEADMLYDTLVDGSSASAYDIALDANGYPVIVWVKLVNSRSNHRYNYMRWTGTSWFNKEMTGGGGEVYSGSGFSGGMTLDHENPNIVFLSREINGQHEIERWETSDGGNTWSTTAITRNSYQLNMRPCVPRGNAKGETNLLWIYGRYDGFTLGEYHTSVRMCDVYGTATEISSFAPGSPAGTAPQFRVLRNHDGVTITGFGGIGRRPHLMTLDGRRIRMRLTGNDRFHWQPARPLANGVYFLWGPNSGSPQKVPSTTGP